MGESMPQPSTDLSAIRAVQAVRLHSRGCRDIAAREYLIRVERRLLAMIEREEPTVLCDPEPRPLQQPMSQPVERDGPAVWQPMP